MPINILGELVRLIEYGGIIVVSDETTLFEPIKTSDNKIDAVVMHAVSTMSNNGYSSVDQIAGYLMSGDPTYITAKEGCRVEMGKIDRFVILEHILKTYIDTLTKENTEKNKEEN